MLKPLKNANNLLIIADTVMIMVAVMIELAREVEVGMGMKGLMVAICIVHQVTVYWYLLMDLNCCRNYYDAKVH